MHWRRVIDGLTIPPSVLGRPEQVIIGVAVIVAASLVLAPLEAEAQQAEKVVRVARLSPISASTDVPILQALRQGLRDRGWVEGQNITFEYRFAEGNLARRPELAAELVRLKVDVIVPGSTSAALAAKNATKTIPIVMVLTGDPVASGLVASLARPSGNITGVTALGGELSGKRMEVLREAVPDVSRVAVLTNPAYADTGPFLKARRKPSRSSRGGGASRRCPAGEASRRPAT